MGCRSACGTSPSSSLPQNSHTPAESLGSLRASSSTTSLSSSTSVTMGKLHPLLPASSAPRPSARSDCRGPGYHRGMTTPPLQLSQDTPAVTDFGVQVYLTHQGTGTYVDAYGVTQEADPLADGIAVEGDWQGATVCTLLQVSVRVDRAGSGLGLGDVDVALERRRRDARNPSLWRPEPLQSVRSDGADPVTASTHTITGSGNVDLALRTTDVLLSGDVRVRVTPHGASLSGERVAVAFDVAVTG